MSLPKINTPEYRLNIPSTDEEIRYRPFLVKEEKVLLIAQETGTDKATYEAIRTIIKSCTLDEIDIDKLPLFDMEYIFLNIRAKSVGEVAKLKVKCPDDEETEVDVEVDLTKIQVQMDEKHDARIELTDDIGVLMMYPNFGTVTNQSIETPKGQETEKLFDMISDCMYQIWHGEETYDAMDYSIKERKAFLDSLNHQQFEKLQNFFETMPTLKHDVEVINPKTNVTSTLTLQGLSSFF
jgi:hypothetical protein